MKTNLKPTKLSSELLNECEVMKENTVYENSLYLINLVVSIRSQLWIHNEDETNIELSSVLDEINYKLGRSIELLNDTYDKLLLLK